MTATLRVPDFTPGGRWAAVFRCGLAFRHHSKAAARSMVHYGEPATVRRWSRRMA
jgi:hypothetical protein